MDEKQVKPLVDMVVSGIMSVPRAREMLGIPAEETGLGAESAHSWSENLEATAEPALCDECNHFNAESNQCRVHNTERTFDSPACRFIDRRES
jgi:hypothetical protein